MEQKVHLKINKFKIIKIMRFFIKKSLNKISLIILTLLLSSGIMYSQTNFWELTNFDVPTKQYGLTYFITVADNGDVWALARHFTIPITHAVPYLSTDNGDTWIRKGSIPLSSGAMSIAVSPVNNYIFVGTENQGLFRSTDNGETWGQIKTISGSSHNICITQAGEIYFGSLGNVYYSNDNGDTWVEKSNGLFNWVILLTLGIDGTLYAMTNGGLYCSTNGGDTWLPPPSDQIIAAITGLTVSDDGSIFVTTSTKGVLKSTDKGVTWSWSNNGLNYWGSNNWVHNMDSIFFYCRGITYNSKTGHIFMITEFHGIYRSTDLGASWHEINNGLIVGWAYNEQGRYLFPVSRFFALASNSKTGQVFISSISNISAPAGTYRSIEKGTGQVVFVEEPEETPTNYSLSQNYPNPFNPTTKIQYSLPEASNVRLSVYNGLGQEVMQLVNGNQSAGKYIVDLNAQNLPSGIYFYRLQNSKFVDTKKMLLLK